MIPAHFLSNKSNRELLVKYYEITPLRRFQCLPGKPILNALYRRVDDIAYQFEAYSRDDPGRTRFWFYSGHASGDDFLRLTQRSLPPLQTWELISGPSGGGSDGTTSALHGTSLDPFNAQLLTLLSLFFLKYELDPSKPSAKFFSQVNLAPTQPQKFATEGFNTVLLKYRETSRSLVGWLSAQVGNKSIRPMRFDLLHAHVVATCQAPAIFP
jgi:hypothetical protein